MTPHVQLPTISSRKRQGRLLAFGMTGAMALAVSACSPSNASPDPTLVVPPTDFNPRAASYYMNTNQPPTNATIYSPGGGIDGNGAGGYLTSHGYYQVYGFPSYYYRPAPGTTVELVSGGGTAGYRAGSPAEARSVARGGFGGSGGRGGWGS